jgi:hypothetical protein
MSQSTETIEGIDLQIILPGWAVSGRMPHILDNSTRLQSSFKDEKLDFTRSEQTGRTFRSCH